jgi:hypothetical protein
MAGPISDNPKLKTGCRDLPTARSGDRERLQARLDRGAVTLRDYFATPRKLVDSPLLIKMQRSGFYGRIQTIPFSRIAVAKLVADKRHVHGRGLPT